MKVILLLSILVVITFCIRLFFFKPSYRRMFKKGEKGNRVSISYAILFDLDSIAKLVQKKIEKSKDEALYIKAYHVGVKFSNTQTLEQIKQTISDFQNKLSKDMFFCNMFYKNYYEILIDMWLRCSMYGNYRIRGVNYLWHLYENRYIKFREFCSLILIFCGF